MTDAFVCLECGFSQPEKPPAELCPKCLLALGVAESECGLDESAAKPGSLPEKIGRYEVIDEIATGGMGVVVRARQPRLDREVAVKIIRDDLLATAGARARFRIEAEAAASLKHPNIVTVFEAGDDGGQEYFSMELVNGHALERELAENGPIAPRRAARILAAVADGVHHAHTKGLLHRDIKPGNILLEPNDHPRVTDFGIALRPALAMAAENPRVAGTPTYMAPEQATGREADLSPASDVFGLGAVLYEMLVGAPPHLATSADEVLMKVLEGGPERPRVISRAVPRDLEAICLRCLEANPRDRYQTAEELAADLRDFIAGKPLRADRGGNFGAALRWLFHRPALALTYVALIIFLANHWLIRSFDEAMTHQFHLRLHLIIAFWAVAATTMQTFVERTRRLTLVRYLWSTLDVVLLSAIIMISDLALAPLMSVYLIIIAATGFRWRPGLTIYTTALSLAAALTVYALVLYGPDPVQLEAAEVFLPITAMIVMGMISAALVKRMRVLAGLEKPRH